jgi:hypothetical protein
MTVARSFIAGAVIPRGEHHIDAEAGRRTGSSDYMYRRFIAVEEK